MTRSLREMGTPLVHPIRRPLCLESKDNPRFRSNAGIRQRSSRIVHRGKFFRGAPRKDLAKMSDEGRDLAAKQPAGAVD
jgi:hypothetical protein